MDDALRTNRRIETDSPAASRKVFGVALASRSVGIRAVVVSLGRGRPTGRIRWWSRRVYRVGGVPVVYLPYVNVPLLSHAVSIGALGALMIRMAWRQRDTTVLFYNRAGLYLLGVVIARMTGMRTALDLEDGAVERDMKAIAAAGARMYQRLFDACCPAGALLACDALRATTRIRPAAPCYGVVRGRQSPERWRARDISALYGGTLEEDTGARLLLAAIEAIRSSGLEWAKRLTIEVTGKGSAMREFEAAARDPRAPRLIVHGRLDDATYHALMARMQVGLALKTSSGGYASTTFPSKVVELAGEGILVVTTDISDVRRVLGDGACYLERDDPALLVERLRWIVEMRAAAAERASLGAAAVAERCSPSAVGELVRRVLFAHVVDA
jgi:Glycosyltransferase